jgi:hypothetical protein
VARSTRGLNNTQTHSPLIAVAKITSAQGS